MYACYLAINLQNFGGSDVERARRSTSAGFILESRNSRRLTVVVADDEASIVVLIDRPGRREALWCQSIKQRLRLLQIERVKGFSEPAIRRRERFASLLCDFPERRLRSAAPACNVNPRSRWSRCTARAPIAVGAAT